MTTMPPASAVCSVLLLAVAMACGGAADTPAGISIEHNDAEILLGEAGDVRLARGGGGVLSVSGEVVANGTALLAAVQALVLNMTALQETVAAQALAITVLEEKVAAFASLNTKDAIDAAISDAAEPGRLAKAVTDALGRFRSEADVQEALDEAASNGTAAKAVTDALEAVVVQGGVQANLTAAAESVVDASRLADGAVTTDKLAPAAVSSDKIADGSVSDEKLSLPPQSGVYSAGLVDSSDNVAGHASSGWVWALHNEKQLHVTGYFSVSSTSTGQVDMYFGVPPEVLAITGTSLSPGTFVCKGHGTCDTTLANAYAVGLDGSVTTTGGGAFSVPTIRAFYTPRAADARNHFFSVLCELP